MKSTVNHNMNKPDGNNVIDVEMLNFNTDIVDKGLIVDVGDSAGTGNDYIIDISIELSSDNKGNAFRFWADRDSTGEVTINSKYKLLKGIEKPVSNIKKGSPYTVVFNGENFFLASGGSGAGNDTVNFTSDKLLEGYSANNSDGDKVDGTMKNRGKYINENFGLNSNVILPNGYYESIRVKQNLVTHGASTDAVSQRIDSGYLYTGIPVGAYFTKTDSGYPEIRSKISDVSNTLKTLPSDKEQEIINTLGAKMFFNGDLIATNKQGETNEFTFNIGFKPTFVLAVPYSDVTGDLTFTWIHIRTTEDGQNYLNRGWREYNASSSSSTSMATKVISLTDTGFVYRKDANQSVLSKDTTLKLKILAIG